MLQSSHHPPDWMDAILEWYCSDYYLEEVQGDLHEWYDRKVMERGYQRARLAYLLAVFRYFRFFRLKPVQNLINNPNYLSMKTILKITFRNLKKDKISGFLRISNLILGISIFLIALVYSRYELSYDQFHNTENQLFRVGIGDHESAWAATPIGIGAFALEKVPEIQRMCRFIPLHNTWVKRGESIFYEKGGLQADSSVFEMFGYEFIEGDPKTALKSPDAIVLTESIAKKYFGDENPMGQTVETLMYGVETRVVTGIIKDVPEQTHLKFDYLCSMYSIPAEYLVKFRNFFVYTYVQVEKGADMANVKSILFDGMAEQYHSIDGSDGQQMVLTPVSKIHLFTNHEKEYADNGNINYVYILFCTALFVLVISCINFINLTVIKGLDRAKEVGLRKTVGASKHQLIYQFLSENLVLLVLAGISSILLLTIFAPAIKVFSGLDLPLNTFQNPELLIPAGLILLVLELISGLYPAVVLSRFRPAEIIKPGSPTIPMRRVGFTRKVLIVTQFSLSLILVIVSMVVFGQLKHIQEQDLGFEKDQVAIFELNNQLNEKIEVMKDKLLQSAGVQSVAISSSVPGYRIMLEGIDVVGKEEGYESRLLLADRHFIEAYSVEIKSGKNFSKTVPLNQTEYIINEKMAERMFPDIENPLGSQLIQREDTGRLVAIVKDFNFQTLHNEVEPLTIKRVEKTWGHASIRFQAKSVRDVLTNIESASQEVYPDLPVIEVEFLDNRFKDLYQAETKLQYIVWILCIITILLTISGIFGITVYNAQKRAKELAIRKVLGGDIPELMKQLSRHFVVLLVCSFAIGLPGAYFLSDWWLQDFAYRTVLNPVIFGLSVIIMIAIVILSSVWVTLKAAQTNPAIVLKNE